ncbi:hypothetical protein KAW18_19320 [candidate division WOR-3 bacterium]|nr:hypothetical protein [candidate division WOR-3 bacterium]
MAKMECPNCGVVFNPEISGGLCYTCGTVYEKKGEDWIAVSIPEPTKPQVSPEPKKEEPKPGPDLKEKPDPGQVSFPDPGQKKEVDPDQGIDDDMNVEFMDYDEVYGDGEDE